MKQTDTNIEKGHPGMPLACRYCWEAFQPAPTSWTDARLTHPHSRSDRQGGLRGCGLCLAIFLIPGTALCASSLHSELKSEGHSRPYLAVVGSPDLRFRDALVPQPDLSTHPPAGAPPHPMAKAVAVASRDDLRQAEAPTVAAAPPPAPGPRQAGVPEGTPVPAAILPDETRPKVRPEDFLPYFQFPGSRENPEDVSNVPAPPEPGRQPLSTATYRQQ